MARAEPGLRPTTVIERATGREVYHPVRRSNSMHFGVSNEDLVVSAINRRIAAASGTRTEQGEPLQLLRYGPGGEFKPHHDAEKEGGNQRILTALVYLSDDYEGGETQFTRADYSFRGRKGDISIVQQRSGGRPSGSIGGTCWSARAQGRQARGVTLDLERAALLSAASADPSKSLSF